MKILASILFACPVNNCMVDLRTACKKCTGLKSTIIDSDGEGILRGTTRVTIECLPFVMGCPKCKKEQREGKFCLECGTKLEPIIFEGVYIKKN